MRYGHRYSPGWLGLLAQALLLLPISTARAQPGCDTSRVTVAADLSKRQLGALPFDVPFTIRTPVPTLAPGMKLDSIVLLYGNPLRTDTGYALTPAAPPKVALVTGAVPPTELSFQVGALRPKQNQYFDFYVYATRIVKAVPNVVLRTDTIQVLALNPTTGTFVAIRDSTVEHQKMDTASVAVDKIRLVAMPRTTLSNHFDADAGVVWAPEYGYWGVGTNSHFYLRPVNRNQCTNQYQGLDHLLKRVSVFGGISLFRIHRDTEVEHLWANGSPVVGIGVNRLPKVPAARLNAGIIWLRQDDPNPLVTRDRTKRNLFVSSTIDFELRQLVAPLATLLGR